jgi:hypothetical protein
MQRDCPSTGNGLRLELTATTDVWNPIRDSSVPRRCRPAVPTTNPQRTPSLEGLSAGLGLTELDAHRVLVHPG